MEFLKSFGDFNKIDESLNRDFKITYEDTIESKEYKKLIQLGFSDITSEVSRRANNRLVFINRIKGDLYVFYITKDSCEIVLQPEESMKPSKNVVNYMDILSSLGILNGPFIKMDFFAFCVETGILVRWKEPITASSTAFFLIYLNNALRRNPILFKNLLPKFKMNKQIMDFLEGQDFDFKKLDRVLSGDNLLGKLS